LLALSHRFAGRTLGVELAATDELGNQHAFAEGGLTEVRKRL